MRRSPPTAPRASLAAPTSPDAAAPFGSVVVWIAEDMRVPCGQSGGAAVEGVSPARGAPPVARVTAEERCSAPRPGPDVAGRRGPRLRASRGRLELRRGRSSELALASRSWGGASPGVAGRRGPRWRAGGRPEGRPEALPSEHPGGETDRRAPPPGKVTGRASATLEPPEVAGRQGGMDRFEGARPGAPARVRRANRAARIQVYPYASMRLRGKSLISSHAVAGLLLFVDDELRAPKTPRRP